MQTGRYTVRLTNRNAKPWTRWDEIRQRAGNVHRMLFFAWLALRYDSATFAAVFVNSARDAGDGLIARMTMASGRDISIITEKTPKTSEE